MHLVVVVVVVLVDEEVIEVVEGEVSEEGVAGAAVCTLWSFYFSILECLTDIFAISSSRWSRWRSGGR